MSTVGRNIGMGPIHYQKTGIIKCEEKIIKACETDSQCCSVVACEYCLEWEEYGEDPVYGLAVTDESGNLSGEVAGFQFRAEWERVFRYAPSVRNSIGMSFSRTLPGTLEATAAGSSQGFGEFYIQTAQVTQGQYEQVMGTNPSHFSGTDLPVEMVNLADAREFIRRLNELPEEIESGRTYRLPTEDEWEYACRAGSIGVYSFGNAVEFLSDYAWYEENSDNTTHEIIRKQPNAWQIYDMHGNVWEWTNLAAPPPIDDLREGLTVVKGGSWASTAEECEAHFRRLEPDTLRENTIGFRLILETVPTKICSLMVYVDDQIRGSIPLCADFITCRDASAWVTVTDKDEYGNVIRDGVLRWDRRELRELPYRKDENRCTQKFCGNCDCTCRELCVTITDPEGAVTRGELPDISYSDCEGPLWSGVVGEYDVAVELGRDADDDSCILNVVSNGEDGGWVEVIDCKTLAAAWTLYDGTTIEVVCKVCEGCEAQDTPIDLPFCLCSPVGTTLNFTMIGSGTGVCEFSGELTYQEEAILPTWISAPFTLPTKPTATEVTLRLFCDSTAGSLFPANGFTEEDAAEVNTAFWYSVGLYPTSGEGPRTTIPHYYRQPDDILGWVGRCRDGFFLVVRYLNDICGSVVGDGLVTVVITE